MANSIVRFDPFEDLSRLQREMNRLFNDSYSAPTTRRSPDSAAFSAGWAPAVDVAEDASEITLKIELPGVKKDEIDLELSSDTLTIRGEKKFEEKEKAGNYVRIERSFGKFQRTFSLSVPIQQDKITANFSDGVLTVRLPKSEASKPKKVLVQDA
jgi:HSP20 family protein